MTTAVYLARTHDWLHEQFLRGRTAGDGWRLCDVPSDGELVIFPVPGWRDPDAPDTLSSLPRSVLPRIYLWSQEDHPIAWAPGVFASLSRHRASSSVRGGFYVPHHHVGEHSMAGQLTPQPADTQDLLWSFVGTVENAPDVRGAIVNLTDERALAIDTQRWSQTVRWDWQETHRAEAQAAFKLYVESVRRAKFVVCPRGAGLSSIRLFETMEAGRCPVIVSDEWLAPPFVDWSTCSVSIPESQIAELPAILRNREHDAPQLGRAARAAWEALYAPDQRLSTLVRSCLEIRRNAVPAVGRRAAMAVKAAPTRAALRRARTLAHEARARGN